MKTLKEFEGLKHKVITVVDTQFGYLQVLEYVLQDKSFLHIVQWHYTGELDNINKIPKTSCKSFYKSKNKALELAHEIGKFLLEQY